MNITTYVQDMVRGTRIVATKKFLEKSDFWTREQIDAYQLHKLQNLIAFSYKYVPYYKNLFDNIGLKPEDIQALSDIKKIPILTKEIVRQEYKNLVASNININSHKIKEAKTGGTTGMPLKFYKNAQTRDFTWGAYYRWYNWMGIKYNDKEVVLWGDSSVLKANKFKTLQSKIINKLDKTLYITSFNLNEHTIPIFAQDIINFKPIFLRGYLSAILQLAKYFKEHSLALPMLKGISTTTETLLPIYREYIENVFGVKMFDQYGCGECNSIAFECSAHMGMHINEEHCILEVLDDSDNYCNNTSGRVVVTDLDNYAFPFVRYENEDSAIMSSNECVCGRHSKMLKSISGRLKDVIYLKDGSAVHGVFFTDIFHELGFDNFEYFTRFQIFQEKKGDFICRLEKTDKQLPVKELELIKSTLLRFGNDVEIEVLNQLKSDKSGKFRYVVSDIKN